MKRVAGLALFIVFSLAALFYGMEKFDFVFIERDMPIFTETAAETESQDMSEEDKRVEEQVGNLAVGDNLSDISSDDKKDPENVGSADTDAVENSVPSEPEYPDEDTLLGMGYVRDDGIYLNDGEAFLAEVLFSEELTRDHVKGMKKIAADFPKTYEEGGESFYSVGEKEVYRFSVETYMGYILLNDRATVRVISPEGEDYGNFSHTRLRPAYARDSVGNPLFFDENGKYILFDRENGGRKLYSVYYDATDSRGVYFDYGEDFGISDNGLSVFMKRESVSFRDELDVTDYYILSSVDPDWAYTIYIMKPDYAKKVARYNPRFALALEDAKKRVAEEKAAEAAVPAVTEEVKVPETEAPETVNSETEALDAVSLQEIFSDAAEAFELDTPALTESGTVGENETDISDASERDTESDTVTEETTETEEITETEEVTEVTEEITDTGEFADTEEFTDTMESEETEETGETELVTETETATEASAESETEPKPSDPNILSVKRTETLPRYAYGRVGEDRDSLDYKYAKAYAFSEGRAAVVDDDGVLRYIDVNGNVVIDGTGTKMVTSSRYITTEYAEPLYRHSENSKGYIYFEEGLVRVRRIERDLTFRNLVYSDSDLLLYPDGSEFKIPYGYTLIAYSEGVLVLQGQNGRYGYYHKNGYWIAQPVYTYVLPFSEGLGVIGFEGGNKGVIDRDGNVVIPFAYEYITAPSGGLMTLYNYESGWTVLSKMRPGEDG